MAKRAALSNRAPAYSYVRFSSPEQSKGDSFRRQTEAARAYAERNGLDLQDLTFRDLGVSAYRGKNAAEGALGQFIAAVDSGKVARGSYLLVENLDRLSRGNILPAINLLASLIGKGVSVVTLTDGRVYASDSLNDLMGLLVPMVSFARGHDESSLKSRRIGEAWQNKRDALAAGGGAVLTARAPAWLRVRDGSFEAVPQHAATLRRIFKMALAGHGSAAIAGRLNDEGVAPFNGNPKGWYPAYIHKLLRNPAVIGQFQPMRYTDVARHKRVADGPPIDGYFPAVVSPTDFYRVRRGASGHKRKGETERRPLANLLSGMARCGLCGSALYYTIKGRGNLIYLSCAGATRHTCKAKGVRYDAALIAILNSLDDNEIDLRGLIGGASEDQSRDLRHRIEAADGRIAETETSIKNLLDALERRPSALIEKRMADNEAALDRLRKEKAALDAELAGMTNGGDSIGDLLSAVREANRQIGSVEFNARLNANLKRIISRVELSVSDGARKWFDAGIRWTEKHGLATKAKVRARGKAASFDAMHRAAYAEIAKTATISIGVGFHVAGRHLVILADPRKPGRFAAGAVRQDAKGAIENFAFKVWL